MELWRQVHQAAVIVLRSARLKADRAGVQVDLVMRQHQNLALHPPPEGVRDTDSDLKVWAQVTPHGFKPAPLEEAGTRVGFLQLMHDGQAKELTVLVRQAKHPAKHPEFPVDSPVRCPLTLAKGNVAAHVGGANTR